MPIEQGYVGFGRAYEPDTYSAPPQIIQWPSQSSEQHEQITGSIVCLIFLSTIGFLMTSSLP